MPSVGVWVCHLEIRFMSVGVLAAKTDVFQIKGEK